MKSNWFSLLLTLAFTFVIVPISATAETGKPYWKISGQLEEACKCDAACPCWFNAKPTHMNCGGQLVYFIDKGIYGNTRVDGLAFARTGQNPDGTTMMETMGNWVFDYLYIDEKATPEQRKALEDIAWTIQPKSSPNIQVRFVPITRTITDKEHKVTIGDYGTFSAHLMQDITGKVPTIHNAPGSDPIRSQFQQGLTTSFRYTDASQNWNQQNSNYMFNNFEVDSKQYAEFNAAVMKYMESMKKQDNTATKHCH